MFFWHPVTIRTGFLGAFVRPYFSIMTGSIKAMSERIEMERLLKEQTAWKIERDELRQENADLTEKINQLEVLAGELLKEVKYLQAELIKQFKQSAAQQGA